MTKLTNAMRAATTRRLLDAVAAPRGVALRAREAALAVRMLRHRYGADVFDRCRALPAGWLHPIKVLNLEHNLVQALPRYQLVKGRYASAYPPSSVSLAEFTPLPVSASAGWDRAALGPLYDDLYGLFEDHKALHDELTQVQAQTEAVLASFSTVERLADGWPEGYAALPAELLAPAGHGVPTPRIADLNARLAALRMNEAA